MFFVAATLSSANSVRVTLSATVTPPRLVAPIVGISRLPFKRGVCSQIVVPRGEEVLLLFGLQISFDLLLALLVGFLEIAFLAPGAGCSLFLGLLSFGAFLVAPPCVGLLAFGALLGLRQLLCGCLSRGLLFFYSFLRHFVLRTVETAGFSAFLSF